MRHFICVFCLLLPALPAKATIIDFAPSFVIAAIEGSEQFAIENFSIVSQNTTNTASGSGGAVATINDWDSAAIRVDLGAGPGEAEASLVNITTFDLVFEEPVEVGLEVGFGVNGPLETDLGDSSFANWDISIDIDGFVLGESQEHRCDNGVAVIGSCFNFFDNSVGQFPFLIGDDLRLRVTTTMRFDIGVSTSAFHARPLPCLRQVRLPLHCCRFSGSAGGRSLPPGADDRSIHRMALSACPRRHPSSPFSNSS